MPRAATLPTDVETLQALLRAAHGKVDNLSAQLRSRDVLIENLTCLHGHGISIGSGTRNGLSHIIVRHCTFDGADNGLRLDGAVAPDDHVVGDLHQVIDAHAGPDDGILRRTAVYA